MARLKLTKKAVEACPPRRQGRDPVGRRAERLRLQNHAGQKTASTFSIIEPEPHTSVVRQLAPMVR